MPSVRRLRAFRSILVPTDFSAGARRAALRAAHLPLAARGRIHLVHVLPPSGAADVQRQTNNRLAREALRIEKAAHAAKERKPPAVALKALAGVPFVEIIRYAREVDAELIVLGRKGAGADVGQVLGSTAARVVRMSDIPVLVVGTKPQKPYRRPLIALPLDPSARRLIELVVRTAQRRPRVLPVVRAYHVPFGGFVSAGTDAEPSLYHRQCREEAEAALKAQVETLGRHGIRVKPILSHGDARSVILSEAVRERADLIALGTHARAGIAHALLGSVAEWVVANTKSDVLIARPVRFTFELP